MWLLCILWCHLHLLCCVQVSCWLSWNFWEGFTPASKALVFLYVPLAQWWPEVNQTTAEIWMETEAAGVSQVRRGSLSVCPTQVPRLTQGRAVTWRRKWHGLTERGGTRAAVFGEDTAYKWESQHREREGVDFRFDNFVLKHNHDFQVLCEVSTWKWPSTLSIPVSWLPQLCLQNCLEIGMPVHGMETLRWLCEWELPLNTKKLKFIFILKFYLHLWECMPCAYGYPWRPEKGVGASGAGVTRTHEPPKVSPEIWTQALWKSSKLW